MTMDKFRRGHKQPAGLYDEIVVDNFAGGGGASMGIERAMGRAVDVAINHDRAAIEMHQVNHPGTLHLCEDVWHVDPVEATAGRRVGLAWFSPDCKHFSRAKGAKPVEKKIRGLAWIVVRWARRVRPRVIMLENVREFAEWGPLTDDNRPCPVRKGTTFRLWLNQLIGLGYAVEWRVLDAADYGAPTHRRRLFLIARCDGAPIVWPAPTHGPNRAKPWRTAAEIIDWTIPCPSIFGRKRPLAEKTMRRIAMGIKRYVLDNPKPFIVKINHGVDHFRGQPLERPLSTVTHHHGHALVTPTLVAGYGEREGQEPRASSAEVPLGSVVASPKHALVTAFLSQFFGGMVGKPVTAPVPTTTGKGPHEALVTGTLMGVGGAEYAAKPRPLDEPRSSVLPNDRIGIAAAHLTQFRGSNAGNGGDPAEPLPALTAGGNHAGLVRAFLMKYYGQGCGQVATDPLHTVTVQDRFGLVTVEGVDYTIADIGLRMLTPRELARAQGFPESYILTGSKASQVAKIGNSVCPVMAEVLVRANVVGAERVAVA